MIPGGPASEDNDSSDIENQSHEDEMDHDDEPLKEDQFRQQIEQEKQLIVKKTKVFLCVFSFFIFPFRFDNRKSCGVSNRSGSEKRKRLLKN